MIRAVVFDFDGLIVDTETALIDSFGDVHLAHGLPFDRATFLRAVGQADYAFDPWQAFGPAADRTALEALRRDYNHRRDLAQTVLPGVVALLDAARAHGLRTAVASNSRRPHVEGQLLRRGLRDRFEFLACRDDVAAPKPAPDLYQSVLAQFHLAPQEAIAFEDSHPGTLAAKRAGLWVVAVPNASTAHHDFAHVDLRVASMAECVLADLLRRFAGD